LVHSRIRINCCAIFDILTFDDRRTIQQYQVFLQLKKQDDLIHFGHLILALACGTTTAIHEFNKAMDHLGKQYPPQIKETVAYLISKPSNTKSIDYITTIIGPKLLQQLSYSMMHNDVLEYELARELENSRLVRLLCKLGFVNERPE
jgi:PAB-dependent poly(A)-specific ribonuclease subunit 3